MKPLPVSSVTVLASVASGCSSRDSADQVRTSLQYNNDHRLLCSGCGPSSAVCIDRCLTHLRH